MKYIQIEEGSFKQLISMLQGIEAKLSQLDQDQENYWWDNDQLCNYLGISKRTLQTYRDKQLIRFSQHGSKIWYKSEWVQDFLEKHEKKP